MALEHFLVAYRLGVVGHIETSVFSSFLEPAHFPLLEDFIDGVVLNRGEILFILAKLLVDKIVFPANHLEGAERILE